ncbi:unnamed protein product [Candidula unifasciata]|uniref:Uncharacterized protein n=1 Tax=Candidula unifasciata TaxID=100452 RepID=A0A8S3ZTC6_9EUPU|nr:unnamed protein product [Candidula unifasciata]
MFHTLYIWVQVQVVNWEKKAAVATFEVLPEVPPHIIASKVLQLLNSCTKVVPHHILTDDTTFRHLYQRRLPTLQLLDIRARGISPHHIVRDIATFGHLYQRLLTASYCQRHCNFWAVVAEASHRIIFSKTSQLLDSCTRGALRKRLGPHHISYSLGCIYLLQPTSIVKRQIFYFNH